MSTADLLRLAAAGREEYAMQAPPDQRLILHTEANTLRHAAEVVEGRLDILRTWIPSWRWTQLFGDGQDLPVVE